MKSNIQLFIPIVCFLCTNLLGGTNSLLYKDQTNRFFNPSKLNIRRQQVKANQSSWEMTEYVWDFGIAQVADIGLCPDPFFYFKHREFLFNKRDFKLTKDKNIIWTNPDTLKKIYPFLINLVIPSVLIVNDGDNSFPRECGLTDEQINKLLNHPNLIHVFAQNLDCEHPKVSPIPIGIDFHSLAYKQDFSRWGEKESPKNQEAKLTAIINSLKPTYLRKKRIFIDFHLTDTMRIGHFKRWIEKEEDRTLIFQQILRTGLVDYLEKPIPRTNLWKKKGEYAFTVSPHGNGLDCHRTWEDLALGCIVIVKTSSIDSLYEGLPVVIVKDWDEITEKNLDQWLSKYLDEYQDQKYKNKLKNTYWIQKIKMMASLHFFE